MTPRNCSRGGPARRCVKLAPSVGSVPEATDYLALFDYNVGTLAQALSAASN